MFRPRNRTDDDAWQTENAWVQQFLTDDADLGQRVLGHAIRRYDESVKRFERLDARAAELIRTAGMLAGIEVAAYSALRPAAAPWPFFVASLVCLVVVVFVCIVVRAPRRRPMMLSVRELADGAVTAAVEQRDSWQAGSLHLTTEGYFVVNNWMASGLAIAHYVFATAVALLVPWAVLIAFPAVAQS